MKMVTTRGSRGKWPPCQQLWLGNYIGAKIAGILDLTTAIRRLFLATIPGLAGASTLDD